MKINLCDLEMVLDSVPPRIMVVELAYIFRVMYLSTRIEFYNTLSSALSIYIEEHPGVGRVPVHHTNLPTYLVETLCV